MKLIIIISLLLFSCSNAQQNQVNTIPQIAKQAYTYCQANNMDLEHCIFINLNSHSGKYRFFIWDFNQQQIINKSLCCEGSCNYFKDTKKYSNRPNSYCSSLGKYKIGQRAPSRWGIGIHYKLHGLETANNNAYKRTIVLHSFNSIPNQEIYPNQLMYSQGCPTISNQKMHELDQLLQTKSKPVLLWVFE